MKRKKVSILIKTLFLSSLMLFLTACGGESTSQADRENSIEEVAVLVETPVTQEDLAVSKEVISDTTFNSIKVADWIPEMETATKFKKMSKVAYIPTIKILSQKVISNGDNIDGWMVYDKSPSGATIETVNDEEKGSVIKLTGDGLKNGYVIGYTYSKGSSWKDKTNTNIKWSMNYSEDFMIYVRVNTKEGYRYLYYTNSNKNYGEVNYDKPHYIHNGLGVASNDGTWRTFSRDLSADLKRFQPSNEIISVDGFFVRGSGLIDDVELFSSNSDESNCVIYEDAEDGKNSRWSIYTSGHRGTVSNIYDDVKSSRVIELDGEGTKTGYILGAWDGKGCKNTINKNITWDMNFNDDYVVYISVITAKGHRFITYSPLSDVTYAKNPNYGRGVQVYGDYTYIHLGLNPNTRGGSWQTVSRNLETDLKKYEPDNSLVSVSAFLVRGTGKLDNIKMFDLNESNDNEDDVNNIPVATAQAVTVNEDSTDNVIILAGTDADGDTLTYAIATQPTYGTVTLTGNIAKYTPTANYTGADSFSFKVNDGTVDSAPATVTITVSDVAEPNVAPVAKAQAVTVDEDTTDNVITLSGTDADGDTLTYAIATQPSHGTLTLTGNIAKYTPTANYTGADSFSFKVNDGTVDSAPAAVTITVKDVSEPNVAPVATAQAVTVNEDSTDNVITLAGTDANGDTLTYAIATQPTHGTVTLTGNIAKYTPTANYTGADSFSFKVNDGTVDSAPATVTITVTDVAEPVALPNLADATIQTYTKNSEITLLKFVNRGGAVDSCTVAPVLPAGLSIEKDGSTCKITGTPTTVTSEATYTVTGTNVTGSDTAIVVISVVNDIMEDLLINEISSAIYNNSARWFELYNPTSSSIDISDYTLKSRYYDGSEFGIFEFPLPSKIIPAGGYLIVRPNYGPAYDLTLPDIENNEVVYLKDTSSTKYPVWYSLSNGFLELLKAGKTIDFVTFGHNFTPTTETAWIGSSIPSFGAYDWKSIARDTKSTDTNTLSDWVVREFPTYAGVNDVTCNDDVDEDGIPDCSEVSGSTYVGMNLYAFGARTNQKDIFIEVDYMDSTNGGVLAVDEGVIPQQRALEKVRDSFASNGYIVHFDVGDLFTQDGSNLNPNLMNLGGGNEIAYSLFVNLGCSNEGVNARDYKAANMETKRKQIFYYMVFGTSQGGDSSGCAERPGNDSLITLGGWNLSKNSEQDTNKLINFQAGTVMHEFGHNLGLQHGGDESKNYKPNYVSVMNYLYQLLGLATISDNEGDRYYAYSSNNGCSKISNAVGLTNPFWGNPDNFILDYSHGGANSLDEVNGIVEENGLGYPNSGTVDFNCNKRSDDILTDFNVNKDGITDILHDHDDWSAINIVFSRTYRGSSGITNKLSQSIRKVEHPVWNDVQKVAKEPSIKIPTVKIELADPK